MKRFIKKSTMIVILFFFGYFKRGSQFERSGYGHMGRIWFVNHNGKETIHGVGDYTSYVIPFNASVREFIKFVRTCRQSSYFDMWEW